MTQGITLTHIATGITTDMPLNGKEIQLAIDNTETLNKSWRLMCESVYSREGIWIEGNYEVDTIVISGVAKLFH